MSKFQIILLVVFGFFIVVAVILFSFARKTTNGTSAVVVWGDFSQYEFNNVLSLAGFNQGRKSQTITYVEKSAATIGREFTEAVAEVRGPDILLISLDDLWQQRNKLLLIPYSSISERSFKETFIEEGELFLTSEGTYALPFSVDPLVLYYNRDLLSKEGIARPLTSWDEIYAAAAKLTKRDAAGNITQSTIAIGEARNIPNSKFLLSLLMLQAGTPITSLYTEGLRSELTNTFDFTSTPAVSALDFYTQFANPFKPFYSWNRSMLPAETNFISGDAAFYIGFSSELRSLRNLNPTLNIGVALVPQSRVSGKSITYGRMVGVAVSRNSPNIASALSAARQLISQGSISAVSSTLFLPPVRRDILSTKPTDAIMSVFYDAALQSRGWVDPDKERTKSIFSEMIESVTSGRASTVEAVGKANSELEALIQ